MPQSLNKHIKQRKRHQRACTDLASAGFFKLGECPIVRHFHRSSVAREGQELAGFRRTQMRQCVPLSML